MNDFIRKFREILVYGDNQALEITAAGGAIFLAPMLSFYMISCPAWFISIGVILGFLMVLAIGWDSLRGRMIGMRLLWSWYACIIALEVVGGSHDFKILHAVYWEFTISTYVVWRISREYLHRGVQNG